MISPSPFRHVHNAHVDRSSQYGRDLQKVLGGERFSSAYSEIRSWPGYSVTPLLSLSAIARAVGIESLHYKDESTRFGIGSFKALGGAYAVSQLLIHQIEHRLGITGVSTDDLTTGRYRVLTSTITVTCATDGNHGRSVAWGARLFGCRCVIFIHGTVSKGRADAIASYGAEVRRCSGNYDDAVRLAAQTAAAEHWHVVSDTSYEGYLDIPCDVMQGYAVMVHEALQQLPYSAPPSHIFIQGGVGGLAAAACAYTWERFGPRRPRLIVVEPENAACLLESAVQGKPAVIHGSLETIMAGLSCGEPSLVAWQILAIGADDFLAIRDDPAAACMRLLAAGAQGDPRIVAGESAVAGLAGLLLASANPRTREALQLNPSSRVLLFGTEGATDPEVYRSIVGMEPGAVVAATEAASS